MSSSKYLSDLGSFSTSSSADLERTLADLGLEVVPGDSCHVQWAPESRHHPRQWGLNRKAYNVAFIILYESFEAAMSTVGASAAIKARHDLRMSNLVGFLAFTTTFVIGEGVAGLVFPPMSESFGRKPQYVWSSILFCAFCGLSAVPYIPAIVIGRLLAGFVGGVPPCISPGSLEDIFTSQTRTWGIFAWATASNVGLVLGPIVSSYITNALGWKWVFYIAAVYAFTIFCMSLFFFESRPSLLLSRKLIRIRKETGITSLTIQTKHQTPTFKAFTRDALLRPTRLLLTEPIIIICSLLNALAFALIYALTEALPIVYQSFGLRLADTSLAFLPILVGVVLSAPLRLPSHWRTSRQQRRLSPALDPEHKLNSFLISAPLLCAGLWIFAWTIPPLVLNVHFIVSMLALIPIGLAANDFDAVIAEYLVDVYASYAASAFAAVTWTRALLSVTFTLATDSMFRHLGANVAATICAACTVVVCAGAVALPKWGAGFRKRSKFAEECATTNEPCEEQANS